MPSSTFAKSRPKRVRRRKGVKPTAQVKGYQLNRVIKTVKKMIPRPERKNVDVTRAATIITSTATITNIAPPTGLGQAGEGGIVGDQCTSKSILLRLGITPNATAGMNYYRALIVLDHQPNGAAPVASEILQVANNYLAPMNDSQSKRFKVIFDKTYTVDQDANGSQVDKVFRRLRHRSEALSTSHFITNGVYLLEISNEATNGPTVQWYSRWRYTDA